MNVTFWILLVPLVLVNLDVAIVQIVMRHFIQILGFNSQETYPLVEPISIRRVERTVTVSLCGNLKSR